MAELPKNKSAAKTINCDYNEFESTILKLQSEGAELVTLSASRSEDGEYYLLYYFQKGESLMLCRVPVINNSIPSLYSIYKKADFIEREINNLFGIKFLGHPNLERVSGSADKIQHRIDI